MLTLLFQKHLLPYSEARKAWNDFAHYDRASGM
jgi:hypothetical protein